MTKAREVLVVFCCFYAGFAWAMFIAECRCS
jgi:hypothetical protein